ncbi:MAG: hypothetical protein LBK95_20745 [Bifidobacteriaceae bacterium]|nr:hypothetical protein [Bifidobacteriaceae bacterium]
MRATPPLGSTPSPPTRVLLDTNVVIMRPDATKLASLGSARLMVAAITYAELAEGEFAADPRVRMQTPLDLALAREAYGPGLPFDDAAALMYPVVCRAVVQAGRSVSRARRVDMMLAAVALANGCAIATRNTADFAPLTALADLVEL